MRILPAWLREFVDVPADDSELAEDLTSAGIAVESVQEENGTTVYEMDLTTNRVDAMNHYGVAREASAIYDVELKRVEPELGAGTAGPSTPRPPAPQTSRPKKLADAPVGMTINEGDSRAGVPGAKANTFHIVIEDPHGCARYTARILRNVKIGPSPELIVKRLGLLGSRSINNVADATNYALNELGHPTHAFDLDLLEGGTIIVRRARKGEMLKTLDGVDRKLSAEDLVIADAKKPVALAGVMGGFGTMITERTKNVLIESAWFEPWTVRSMAKRHGMHTDASHRFERGADYGITPLACDRVAELILQSAGGELHGERVDAIGRGLEREPVRLRSSEVRRILGVEIEADRIERILRSLGFRAAVANERGPGGNNGPSTRTEILARDGNRKTAGSEWMVQVPSWRLDVEREFDLLEELARIYGYNKFPNTLPAFSGAVIELPDEAKNAKVRETMLALGYNETICITFISREDAYSFGGRLGTLAEYHPSASGLEAGHSTDWCYPACPKLVALANPLSEEAGYMRSSLLPGLLNMLAYNLNRGTTSVRLFEAGEVFQWRVSAAINAGDRLDEHRHLGFIATGDVMSASVHSSAQPYTFFHMKGEVEELLATFQRESLNFDANVPTYLHPGRSARVVMDGETVGFFGQLHPEQAAAHKMKQDVYLAEMMLDRLYRHPMREPRYRRISKFPAVERDFSFVFADGITWEKIKAALEELQIAELVALAPAEIYRGEKVGPGKYSVLIHVNFQSQDHTLRDDEVARWSEQIIKKLELSGGVLRAQ